MRYILPIAFTLLATTATADSGFYVKVAPGVTMFTKEKDRNTNYKLDSNKSLYKSAAFGYQFYRHLRGDIAFVNLGPRLERRELVGTNTVWARHKPNVNALFVNGYVDLMQLAAMRPYISGGVGVAHTRDKISKSTITPAVEPEVWDTIETESISSKQQYNFAYRLAVGSTIAVIDQLKFDFSYEFADFGQTRKAIYATDDDRGRLLVRSHSLIFAIRWNL